MEFTLIERIRQRAATSRDDVLLGIGDDAALLQVPAGQTLVAAIDTLVESVHFPSGTAAADLGWKALAVNLSDLAAMGASPAWALFALTLPAMDAAALNRFVDGVAAGFMQLAQPYRVALVGGDTTRGALTLSVAAHGFVPAGQALRRDGACVGDALLVTGSLGDAAAGLHWLQHPHGPADPLAQAALLARLNRPTPRIAAGLILRGRASACIDISDGLLADLGHLCVASGVGAELELAWLPRSPALRALYDDDLANTFALSGGDDYELCFSVPPARLGELTTELERQGCMATRIGRIVGGHAVRVRDENGVWLEPGRRGWDHFDT